MNLMAFVGSIELEKKSILQILAVGLLILLLLCSANIAKSEQNARRREKKLC